MEKKVIETVEKASEKVATYIATENKKATDKYIKALEELEKTIQELKTYQAITAGVGALAMFMGGALYVKHMAYRQIQNQLAENGKLHFHASSWDRF